jgi:hypothetical protein
VVKAANLGQEGGWGYLDMGSWVAGGSAILDSRSRSGSKVLEAFRGCLGPLAAGLDHLGDLGEHRHREEGAELLVAGLVPSEAGCYARLRSKGQCPEREHERPNSLTGVSCWGIEHVFA